MISGSSKSSWEAMWDEYFWRTITGIVKSRSAELPMSARNLRLTHLLLSNWLALKNLLRVAEEYNIPL